MFINKVFNKYNKAFYAHGRPKNDIIKSGGRPMCIGKKAFHYAIVQICAMEICCKKVYGAIAYCTVDIVSDSVKHLLLAAVKLYCLLNKGGCSFPSGVVDIVFKTFIFCIHLP